MKGGGSSSGFKHRSMAAAILLPVFILLSSSVYAGKSLRRSFVHDNLKRTFNIYIPSSSANKVNLPLVIVLHGRGTDGKGMMVVTHKGFNLLADRDGFIVVYPDGIEKNWNDGRSDEESNDRAHRENIDDTGFISALIDTLISDYSIDPGRVYVTGISNGAIMAYRLACEAADKIAAIAPVDGNMPPGIKNNCSPSEPVSVLAINNMDDPMVPYDGGEVYSKFHRVKLGKVLSTDESVAFWVNRNKCSPLPVVTEMADTDPDDGTTITRKEYINSGDGTEVILYSVKGGGHTWPGGVQYLPRRVIGNTSRDIDANEVIWTFFKKHSK